MTYRPQITHASRPATFAVEAVNERGEQAPTAIAGENPLTLYVDRREVVTLMTLGCMPEALAIGYLRNQRLTKSLEDIVAVQVDWEAEACAVTTRAGIEDLDEKLEKRTVTTGCGQGTMFGGFMEEIDRIRLPAGATLDEDSYFALMDKIRLRDSIYKTAGAVHGCALAKGSEILLFVEDVGRHNAVDAIAGQMWLDAIPGHDKIFYTTGRLTSEMVIKCVQMEIPFLVSRSGLTRMGYEIASKAGLTMIGRALGKHYLLFTGRERFLRREPAERTDILKA